MTATRTSKPNYAEWKPSPVRSKAQFVPRYKSGEFGNASPTWNNFEEFWRDPIAVSGARYHIRNRVAGGSTYYDVRWEDLLGRWRGLIEHGVKEADLYISAMAPHRYNVIQGEVWQTENHLLLWYSDAVGIPMREALLGPTRHVEGIEAVIILRRSLDANSWDWLNQLLDNYPGHVVEFSTFSIEWGTVPGFNTVFWECRDY